MAHGSIRVRCISAPVRSDRSLAANVPHVQFEAVMHKRFDVEALRWHDGLDVFICQTLENCRLTGIVQTQNQDSCLALVLAQTPQQSKQPLQGGAGMWVWGCTINVRSHRSDFINT
jgi:hypothetical protein